MTEMKQSHMPLSSGGGVMVNCYLLSHTHPDFVCVCVCLCVCVCVRTGKVPAVPLLYTP